MELLKISDRLRSAAGLVYKGARVADIGTDHGYLPIYLVQNGISECVYACDVRKKPLERAQAHISSYGLDDNITIRLADGLCGIQKDDVDTVTICGMGGKLMKDIIDAAYTFSAVRGSRIQGISVRERHRYIIRNDDKR